MRIVLFSAIACGVAGAAVLACQSTSGAPDAPDDGGAAADSSVTVIPAPALDGGGGGPVDMCRHAEPPPPSTNGTTANGTVSMAVTQISYVSTSALGFDIDGVCTGFAGTTLHDGGSSCAPAAGESPSALVDGVGGIDNATQGLVSALSGTLPSFGAANARIAEGQQTLLFLIDGYAGQANASNLSVSELVSGPLETTLDCDAGTAELPDGGAVPKGNGCDIWSVSQDSVGSGGVARILSTTAYVVNNVLVASFEQFTVSIFGTTVPATGVTLVGTLSSSNASPGGASVYTLTNGNLAGRIATADLLAAFGSVSVGESQLGICPGSPFYASIRSEICSTPDVTADPNAPSTASCDALSFGASIAAIQTRATGEIVDASPGLAPGCDGGTPRCD